MSSRLIKRNARELIYKLSLSNVMRRLCQICSCKSHFFYINMILLSQSDMYVIERIIE